MCSIKYINQSPTGFSYYVSHNLVLHHWSHKSLRDFFTGLYEKESRYFFLFSFITFLEPFIISFRLCSFSLVVASCNFYLKYKKHEVPPPPALFLTESVDENQLINLNWSGLGTTFSSLKKYFVRIIIKITIIFLSCFPVFRSDVSGRVSLFTTGASAGFLDGGRLNMGPTGAKRFNQRRVAAESIS